MQQSSSSSGRSESSVDLAGIFQSVTQSLAENQQALNQADEYNQDHGDNMVQTFQTITRALEQKKGASDSAALAFAANQLAKQTTSESGQLYAQNLTRAADQFQGQKVDAQGALQLLQTLIGAGSAGGYAAGTTGGTAAAPAQAGGEDMLGALLGGLTGGAAQPQPAPSGDVSGEDVLGSLLGSLTGAGEQQQAQQAQQAASAGGGDMLGALLGGLTGENTAAGMPGAAAGHTGGHTGGGLSDGLGLDDLLNAGMAYLQAKQAGGSNTHALLQALLAGSGMGSTQDRQQSTQVVASAFLQALGAFGGRP